jgi:hypothetical protein
LSVSSRADMIAATAAKALWLCDGKVKPALQWLAAASSVRSV